MNCLICESNENVIQPLCCNESYNICRDCINKVDKCPHCRTGKGNDLIKQMMKEARDERHSTFVSYLKKCDELESELYEKVCQNINTKITSILYHKIDHIDYIKKAFTNYSGDVPIHHAVSFFYNSMMNYSLDKGDPETIMYNIFRLTHNTNLSYKDKMGIYKYLNEIFLMGNGLGDLKTKIIAIIYHNLDHLPFIKQSFLYYNCNLSNHSIYKLRQYLDDLINPQRNNKETKTLCLFDPMLNTIPNEDLLEFHKFLNEIFLLKINI